MHWSTALDHSIVEPPKTWKTQKLGGKNCRSFIWPHMAKFGHLFQSFFEVNTLQNEELIPENKGWMTFVFLLRWHLSGVHLLKCLGSTPGEVSKRSTPLFSPCSRANSLTMSKCKPINQQNNKNVKKCNQN